MTIDHHHRARGFTLVELCAVLVIAALLTGMVMPSFARAHRDAQLRASTRRVIAALSLARSTAVAEKTRTRVAIDCSRGVFGIEVERQIDNGKPQFVQEMSSLGRAQRLPEVISIEAFPALTDGRSQASRGTEAETAIVFYADGRADDMVIILRSNTGDQRRLLVASLTGRVRMENPEEESQRNHP